MSLEGSTDIDKGGWDPLVDYVDILAVQPGIGGQTFDIKVLDKVIISTGSTSHLIRSNDKCTTRHFHFFIFLFFRFFIFSFFHFVFFSYNSSLGFSLKVILIFFDLFSIFHTYKIFEKTFPKFEIFSCGRRSECKSSQFDRYNIAINYRHLSAHPIIVCLFFIFLYVLIYAHYVLIFAHYVLIYAHYVLIYARYAIVYADYATPDNRHQVPYSL